MKYLVLLRQYILDICRKHTDILNAVLKTALTALSLVSVNRLVGYNPFMSRWYVIALLSLISSVMPPQVIMLVTGSAAVVNIWYSSHVLAFMAAVIFLVIFLVYLRFDPPYAWVIILVPVLHMFRIPFVIPLVLGLFAVPVSVFPMACGSVFYYFMYTAASVLSQSSEGGLVYNEVIRQVLSSDTMYEEIVIFTVVEIIVYLIRRMSFSHAFYTAVYAGAFTEFSLFLIMNYLLGTELKPGPFFAAMLASVFITVTAQFFRFNLNYAGTEKVQFEDDDYYYYVKAVPKMTITAPERNVKRFMPRTVRIKRYSKIPRDSSDDDK